MDEIKSTESIRSALLRLYNPPALAAVPLAAELVDQGVLTSSRGLYDLLLSVVTQMKPPDGAPAHSEGWRCYRYLQLRYVECVSHEAIASDLGISVRQAGRVHQDALRALSDLLGSGVGELRPRPPAVLPPNHKAQAATARSDDPLVRGDLLTDLTMFGQQEPESGVDAAEVAASVATLCQPFTAMRGVDLHLNFPSGVLPVQVNRVTFRQILLNLVLYLVRVAHGPPGAARAVISVAGEQIGQLVTVTLRWENRSKADRAGAALAPEERELLTVAKHLAELQGAFIDEVGQECSSSELRLRLPGGAVKTILLADDNPDIGKLFRRMLQKTAYCLVHVRTANRVLRLARETRPAAIILDVVMPSHDGWEILAELQNGPTTRGVPVVICSVLPDREFALSLGATRFLSKPVTRPNLIHMLDELLETPRVRRSVMPLPNN